MVNLVFVVGRVGNKNRVWVYGNVGWNVFNYRDKVFIFRND